MSELVQGDQWLAYTFAGLMGLSMLIYAVLDGYDLGVGVLSRFANGKDKDLMIASIGPFWDANETWLVLGVGLLLVAFPAAHGMILSHLYLPVALMLLGLIFRGVAFDYRAKAPTEQKERWNFSFFFGSLLVAFAQGFMLGHYILGFADTALAWMFSVLVGVCVVLGYSLIGACWLILKCEGDLQRKAIGWAQRALIGAVAGIALVSLSTPLVSGRIFDKWFSLPEFFYLSPVPLVTAGLVVGLAVLLSRLPKADDRQSWMPFAMVIGIYVLCFFGLAFSFFPYIVPEKMMIVDAASAPASLWIIFVGTVFVLPVLAGYTVFAYWVFHGKARELHYD
ncbi:cytochrome d ubiquinol oxidase subunit II [Vannielia sp.]|uniref:cytochrome d ubiquinol oxidase subunit II n=1 Tax=Vannielia sp. TaxID=2813045 RepID=UPI002615CFB5|nr:cytochrome d ubiquinol oxidase subunit II [Vannielia sp.]MDF1874106.1 cytochrome d ubiquinol oxidase subunit II [Vannielia sp.]